MSSPPPRPPAGILTHRADRSLRGDVSAINFYNKLQLEAGNPKFEELTQTDVEGDNIQEIIIAFATQLSYGNFIKADGSLLMMSTLKKILNIIFRIPLFLLHTICLLKQDK